MVGEVSRFQGFKVFNGIGPSNHLVIGSWKDVAGGKTADPSSLRSSG
jgi:hypothetical protein